MTRDLFSEVRRAEGPRRTGGKRLLAAVVLAVGGLALAPAAPAWACSCVATTTASHVKAADLVLRGKVTSRSDPNGTGASVSSARQVTYGVSVTRVFKGAGARKVLVQSPAGGDACGLEVVVGREYVIFANRTDSALRASLCGGTTPATTASVNSVTAVTGQGVAPKAAATPQPSATRTGRQGEAQTSEPAPGPPMLKVVGVSLTGALFLAVVVFAIQDRRRPPAGADPPHRRVVR